jgi:ATP-dependent Clp protease ATP-binding subunit ClpC
MHSVAKLIGSPPGYVGYQEGGQLTEQIRRRPYSVVLFDEIEKAHPEVLNVLLQILEEGELTDGRGRTASFQNAVVILTSNIGAEQVARDKKLGFNVAIDEEEQALDSVYEGMRDSLLESLRNEVRPEILNRLDDVIVFRGLNKEDCLEITQILINDLVERMLEHRIELSVPKSVVKNINEQGYSKEYGARNLRRKVQELIENELATFMLDKNIKQPKRGSIRINVQFAADNTLTFKKG